MFANVLLIAFVSAYCAIVLLGHVLLLMAIWPDFSLERRARQHDNADPDRSEPAQQTVPSPSKLAA